MLQSRRPWDQKTEMLLRLAGWFPGRDGWRTLALPEGFVPSQEARKALTEFGGLKFTSKDGFTHIDPKVGEQIADEIKAYGNLTPNPLYPIGIIDGGDTLFLLIDHAGIIYTLTDRLEPFASSIYQAMKYLCRVCAVNQRDFSIDLESIGLYGKFWTLK